MKAVAPGLLFVSLAACETFPPASELSHENQVLALRATPPEVHPGSRVNLDALVHWPAGAPTLSWLVCLPDVTDDLVTCLPNHLPESSLPPLCADAPAARACVAGVGDAVGYTVPADAFPDDGVQHTIFVYMLASAGANGFGECVDTLAGGPPTFQCLLSIKRVVVSHREPANRNPVPTALVVDGVSLDASALAELDLGGADLETHTLSLGITLDATSIDEVDQTAPSEDEPARLTVQWFSTCGELADPIVNLEVAADGGGGIVHDAELTRWKPKQTGACLVHAVVRDENGGAGFFTQRIRIGPP